MFDREERKKAPPFYTKIMCFYFDVLSDDSDAKFCCDAGQVDDMVGNFALISSFMGRCPSCVRNLRNFFCFMTCYPHHNKFITPNLTVEVDGIELISKLNYYVDEDYAVNLYDSCAEVTNPSSNSRAITTLCGSWGELCNADR